jgi:hypothetical protein
MDPVYGNWPRAPYSCGPTGDGKGHNRANYPYQELVFGCATNPPIVDGRRLWDAQEISLPDLRESAYREPLRLANFVFPYVKMDIPSPQPLHIDETEPPRASLRERVLGAPELGLSRRDVKVGVSTAGSTVELVDVENEGTGVLAWYAVASESWLKIAPYTGVAVGSDLPCLPNAPCDRVGHFEISVDQTKVPPGRRNALVRVHMLGSTEQRLINVEVTPVIRVGVPGLRKD